MRTDRKARRRCSGRIRPATDLPQRGPPAMQGPAVQAPAAQRTQALLAGAYNSGGHSPRSVSLGRRPTKAHTGGTLLARPASAAPLERIASALLPTLSPSAGHHVSLHAGSGDRPHIVQVPLGAGVAGTEAGGVPRRSASARSVQAFGMRGQSLKQDLRRSASGLGAAGQAPGWRLGFDGARQPWTDLS